MWREPPTSKAHVSATEANQDRGTEGHQEGHQEQGIQAYNLTGDCNWKTRTSITTESQKGQRWDHQWHKRMTCFPGTEVKFWLKRLTAHQEYSEPASHSAEKCQCTTTMQGAARSAERHISYHMYYLLGTSVPQARNLPHWALQSDHSNFGSKHVQHSFFQRSLFIPPPPFQIR